jgi:hypothetical protein
LSFAAKGGWALDPVCPCDVQLVKYCRARGIRGQVVFHMGSGLHHLVGQELCQPGLDNQVLSVTRSRDEMLTYVDRVIAEPEFGRRYRLLFADLHTLSSAELPRFDLVALFHLCEEHAVAGIDPAEAFLEGMQVVQVFLRRLKPSGRLAFYGGSTGRAAVGAITRTLERTGALRQVDVQGPLSIWAV